MDRNRKELVVQTAPRKRLSLAVATLAAATILGFGATTAFGQVGTSDKQAQTDQPAALSPEDAKADIQTTSQPETADPLNTGSTSEDPQAKSAAVAVAVAEDAIAATVAMFYEPGEVVQYGCILVTERRVLPSVLPQGVSIDDVWLQPNGTLTEALTPEGQATGINELGDDGDRIVLREYDEGKVVTYDIPQDVIVAEFAPCADPTSALEVVSSSDLADLASIYHEASLNADGSIQVLFRVEKDNRYTPEIFDGEFSGSLDSPEYQEFLESMPDKVRRQVEDRAESIKQYSNATN